jgi:hypothetical protein
MTRRNHGPSIAAEILAALFRPNAAVCKLTYRALDSLFDLDRRAADRNLGKLIGYVYARYGFLFERFGGKVVPELSAGDPSMDFATVVIEVKSLYLMAASDRGSIDWSVSTKRSAQGWYPLAVFAPKLKAGTTDSYRLLSEHLPEIEHLMQSED